MENMGENIKARRRLLLWWKITKWSERERERPFSGGEHVNGRNKKAIMNLFFWRSPKASKFINTFLRDVR